MRHHIKRIALLSIGIVFLVLGVIGLFLPILQGILFLAIGVVILGIASPWFKSKVHHHTKRYEKFQMFIDKVEIKLESLFGIQK